MVLLACVLATALVACAPRHQPVQLRFILMTPDGVHRLQFYVHDVVLLGSDGNDYDMRLARRAPWQSERVALVDLSPDAGPQMRDAIEAEAPSRVYTGVRFAVGVPFEMNHLNPLTAAAPLDRGALFWTWQSGYKFLRLDLSASEHEAAFHLGSTGCSSPSALRPPAQPCAQPNVIHVELKNFDPLTQPIQVRVEAIVAALGEAQPSACTGDYSQPACSRAFAATGLDLQRGICARGGPVCSGQQLFFAPSIDPDAR